MRAQESIKGANLSASPAAFQVQGGLYQFQVVLTGGSVDLQALGPDGTTSLSVLTSGTPIAANSGQTVYLPPGTYNVILAAATGVYFTLTRIPTE